MENVLTLKEIQGEALKVLDTFATICENNNFSYFLAYGTLIGAIRHNGFIPWDDDIDVMMPREDFELFKLYCKDNSEQIKPLKLHDRTNTDNYWYGIPRFSNMEFKYNSTNPDETSIDIGVFIDIYPIDNYGVSEENAKKIFNHFKLVNRLYKLYVSPTTNGSVIKKMVKTVSHLFLKVIKGPHYPQQVDKEIIRYLEKNTSYSDRFFGVPVWSNLFVPYDKNIIGNNIEVDSHCFESRNFNIPKNYDYFLKSVYGDYMQLPSLIDRTPHHDYTISKR